MHNSVILTQLLYNPVTQLLMRDPLLVKFIKSVKCMQFGGQLLAPLQLDHVNMIDIIIGSPTEDK